MRRITFVLACLSWVAHGRRVQTSEQVKSNGRAKTDDDKPSNEFASLLLSLNSPAAFNSVGASLRAPVGSHTGMSKTIPTTGKLHPLSVNRQPALGQSARSGEVHMMFDRFNEKTIKSIMLAQEEARRLAHDYVGDEMMIVGVFHENTGVGAKVLKKFGVKLADLRQALQDMVGRGSGFVAVEIPFNPAGKRVLEGCIEQMKKYTSPSVDTSHMLLALIQEEDSNAVKILKKLNVNIDKVREEVVASIKGETEGKKDLVSSASGAGFGRSSQSQTATLDKYGRDLNKMAIEGKIDPVIGREKQIERTIQILARKKKNNPVLIGEPGVGKTAIAEGLAQRIVDNDDIPKFLKDSRVIALDLPALLAGTKYRGEFEERFQNVLKEASKKDIILMIDELHTIVGAGAGEGAVDAGNMMKPMLANGDLQLIGSTTLDEYRKHIEKDKALERRFQPVTVPEPTLDESVQILKGLAYKYEEHHQLRYSRDALEACVKLADQYIQDRFLPDKAIDILDETGAQVRLDEEEKAEGSQTDEDREQASKLKEIEKKKEEAVQLKDYSKAAELKKEAEQLQSKIKVEGAGEDEAKAKTEVSETDVARVVAEWTGVPVEKVTSDESQRLLKLEDRLHGRVIGQDEAVVAVSKAVRRARAGLKNPARPIASFIFCGPTGVGKTELCKALSDTYYGRKEAMMRFDMSEFMERHTVSKLIGSPPGYVGYNDESQLCDKIRRNPYSLILFDEIEKAHPDVFNLMLQILEDGILTDSKGRTVSFKNALIVMTSNVGAQGIEKTIAGGGGFGFSGLDDEDDAEKASYDRLKSVVTDNLKNSFKPEFINRLDEVIVFRSLTLKEISQITDLEFQKVFKRVEDQGIAIEVTERFKNKVVDEGFDPKFGARPIRRAISRMMEDELSSSFLLNPPVEGEIIILDLDDNDKVIVKRDVSGITSKAIDVEAKVLT